MVESTNQGSERVDLWIITDRDYAKLRLISGCETLEDLHATKAEAGHILNLAKGFGIPNERIYRNEGSSV